MSNAVRQWRIGAFMKTTKSIAILCVLVLGSGCGGNSKIRRLTASSVIVAFGDSLTSGTRASEDESYPSVLSGMIESRVVNAGVAGEHTAAGLRRLPAVLKREQPDLVILCEGWVSFTLEANEVAVSKVQKIMS